MATTSFVLAMADVVSSPSNWLDEFDVFQDASNRKVRLHAVTKTWPAWPLLGKWTA